MKQHKGSRNPLTTMSVWAGLLALALAGCSTPAVRQQRLVARPNMTFADAATFQYNSSRLLPQQASGLVGAGAGQNSGCTSCR